MIFRCPVIGVFFIMILILMGISIFLTQPLNIQSEEDFNQKLPHTEISLKIWKKLKYHIWGEGLEGVLVGSNGWLFTNEEFAYSPNSKENIRQNINYIEQVSVDLARSKVKLIIVPIPAKARLYDEFLGRYHYPDYNQDAYQALLNLNLSADHKVLDSLGLFSENKDQQLYYKTDTHWTADAARLVAHKIVNKNQTAVSPIGSESFQGDLVKFVPEDLYDYESYNTYSNLQARNDLFEDPYFPIILIGTSYSADKRWNFENFLKYYLKQDVLNLAQKALGPFQVMQSYLDNEYQSLAKPKIIIWEIPERYLSAKYEHKDMKS